MKNLFSELTSYKDYLQDNPFYLDLGLSLSDIQSPERKVVRSPLYGVVDDSDEPVTVELDDLTRLHFLARKRKVTTILEFGVGKSTVVFNHAIQANKEEYEEFVKHNLRRANSFECHSVDNNSEWLNVVRRDFMLPHVSLHHCQCFISTFNDRICTYYENLPNICPDLIYLDGPDQSSPEGSVRGLHTRSIDRLPMAADILSIEHFLLPGTLLVVDGRTANARFLRSNFQRNWEHIYYREYDQHFFELVEPPLGPYNKAQIEFSLGGDWRGFEVGDAI